MNDDGNDRVGARPLSAFHTADICPEQQQQQQEHHGAHEQGGGGDSVISSSSLPTIGITPRTATGRTVTGLSEEEEDEHDEALQQQQLSSSILISENDDVLGLLQDPHNADPPIIVTSSFSSGRNHGNDGGDGDGASSSSSSSEDEYHSPLEDNDAPDAVGVDEDEADDSYAMAAGTNAARSTTTPIMNASPYDYDVNWDMVGHLRSPQADDQVEDTVQNTSLADAAAASMIATTAAPPAAAITTTLSDEPALPAHSQPPPPQPFSLRRTSSGRSRNSYRYHKYSNQDDPDAPPSLHSHGSSGGAASGATSDAVTSFIMDDLEASASAAGDEQHPHMMVHHHSVEQQDIAEVNDCATSTSSSASATTMSSSSMTHRTAAARRRRQGRASSFHVSSSSSPSRGAAGSNNHGSSAPRPPVVPEESSSRISSSLDSGMAAVRRWIRARTASAGGGGSSRAARRWQREAAAATASTPTTFLQLGEEDLFALTHPGQDPRRSFRRSNNDFHIILEEEDHEDFLVSAAGGPAVRQRALSEPNNYRMRNFFFQRAAHGPSSSSVSIGNNSTSRSTTSTTARGATSFSSHHRRRQQAREQSSSSSQAAAASLDEDASVRSGSAAAAASTAMTTSVSVPAHLSSAALNSSLFHSPQRGVGDILSDEVMLSADQRSSMHDGDVSSLAETTSVPPSTITMRSPADDEDGDNDDVAVDDDPNREARTRWIRINRRFQLIITVVAMIFSLLLFAILVCWVVFTSAYVVSIDKQCDVPLKQYFWLATLQLILDIFRTDIMRFIFRWDTHSNDQIPVRVIMYNIAYLIYALLVLRLGVKSVFRADDSTCPSTAPELYQSSAVFVSLSLAAWSTIVLGYLVPFCFVATLLTWNGYTPTADNQEQNNATAFIGGVFPAAYSTTGAPPGCVDQLRTVLLEEFPDDYPRECCICMGDFVTGEVIVATECQHVFHKRCCEEWLRQARTCPVCRTDIPSSLNPSSSGEAEPEVPPPPPPPSRLTRPFPGREDFHQDVVGLLQILRRQETRLRQRSNSPSNEHDPTNHAGDPSSTITVTGGDESVSGLHVVASSSQQHDAAAGGGGPSSPTSVAAQGGSSSIARSESLPVVAVGRNSSGSTAVGAASAGGRGGETEMVALEEGLVNRQHST